MSNQLVIYHGNCADGFSGAWVLKQHFQTTADKKNTQEFHAGVYQTPPPDVTGKDVVLVDFSYKRPVMEEIVAKANSVLVLDHHKTAEADLENLPGAEVVFDMDRAGSMIAWNYYFPNKTPPKLLEHIQDRDLWKFLLPGTREIQANVFSFPYDFAVWDRLMNSDPTILVKEGEAIERKHHKDIAELLRVTKRRMVIDGWDVPVANLPYTLVSDAANKMAMGERFAACYWDTPKGRVFGLRSITGELNPIGVDVSEVAKAYGGGGHKNAAGFTVSFTEAANFELE